MFGLNNIFSKSKKTKKSSSNKSSSKKSSSNKLNKKNNKSSGKSNKELCSHKYKDKAVRGTPKNWAYNRCVKTNSWERCKNLPPAGWGMHRNFCD
jgi:hypothetical protein